MYDASATAKIAERFCSRSLPRARRCCRNCRCTTAQSYARLVQRWSRRSVGQCEEPETPTAHALSRPLGKVDDFGEACPFEIAESLVGTGFPQVTETTVRGRVRVPAGRPHKSGTVPYRAGYVSIRCTRVREAGSHDLIVTFPEELILEASNQTLQSDIARLWWWTDPIGGHRLPGTAGSDGCAFAAPQRRAHARAGVDRGPCQIRGKLVTAKLAKVAGRRSGTTRGSSNRLGC